MGEWVNRGMGRWVGGRKVDRWEHKNLWDRPESSPHGSILSPSRIWGPATSMSSQRATAMADSGTHSLAEGLAHRSVCSYIQLAPLL